MKSGVEYGKAYYKKTILPKMTLKTSVRELDLEASLAERQQMKMPSSSKCRGKNLELSRNSMMKMIQTGIQTKRMTMMKTALITAFWALQVPVYPTSLMSMALNLQDCRMKEYLRISLEPRTPQHEI